MTPSLPPGPRAPSIVQLAHMAMDPYGSLEGYRARYGDMFTLRWPGQPPMVLVSEPTAVRQLVTGGYDDFLRFADGVSFLIGDHSVILQDGEPHKETRKLMMPPFHGERMRVYGADMAAITDQTLAQWPDGETRSFHKEVQDITLKVILRCVFGVTEEQRLGHLERLFLEYVDAMMSPWFYAATLVISGRRVRDLMRARGAHMRHHPDRPPSRLPFQSVADRLGAIDAMLLDEIARCRRLSDAERSARSDVLSLLVTARYADGSSMSDEALRDHLVTLLIGGHETTATSLAWAVHCALGHPGTLERMRAEVDSVMGDGFDSARIKQLSYISAVASESMRLYPIATGVGRKLKRDLPLAGWTLPAGIIVSPSIYLTQRDPRVWEDPTAFRPERFLSGKASVYEFFPFGAGVWKCLGAQFAEYEMRVVLARLVAQLEVERAPGPATKPVQRGFTVAPSEGLPVRVRRRRQARERAA
jgi:cytochrome P450